MGKSSEARGATAEGADGPRPFLKWAGGKGQLLEQLWPLLPSLAVPGARARARPRARTAQGPRYFEPFVGSGALFFALRPRQATLSDVNRELVDCYLAVQKRVSDVIAALEGHEYEETQYYRVRDQVPAELPPAVRAARTIYLNKTGYNGLYRVNRAGRFNVPFGRYVNPGFASADSFDNLRACSRALRGARVCVRDFGEVVNHARAGDFVYFNPPYVPLSDTSDFTSYVPGGFGREQQERLASVFAKLSEAGVLVMLSNSDTPDVRRLYGRHRIDIVTASRSINSRAGKRGKVREVVVRNY